MILWPNARSHRLVPTQERTRELPHSGRGGLIYDSGRGMYLVVGRDDLWLFINDLYNFARFNVNWDHEVFAGRDSATFAVTTTESSQPRTSGITAAGRILLIFALSLRGRRCSGAIGVIAAVLLGTIPAAATTISIGGLTVDDQGQFSTVPGVTTVDFNALATGTQDFAFGIASYDDVNIFNCACSGPGDLLDDTTNGARALGGESFAINFSEPISYIWLLLGKSRSGQRADVLQRQHAAVLFYGKRPQYHVRYRIWD